MTSEMQKGHAPEPGQRFLDGLRAIVSRRVPAQDVEDVLQDLMLRLHRNPDGAQDARSAEAWVRGVLRNAIAEYHRARSRRRAIEREQAGGDEPADPGSLAGGSTVHEEVLSWLRPMAETLESGYREALLLADFDGRPQREVAAALGLSLSGAKSRVQRARRILGERLRECCHLELDREGKVVAFSPRRCSCRTPPR